MYSILIYLYIFAIKTAALFGHRKACLMLQGHKKIFVTLRQRVRPGTSYLWFHASSLGEFEQGRPVIERLRATHPEYRVILTFFSSSGYESAKDYREADIVCYMPFDIPCNVKLFLDIVQPKKAFFVKYEFWLNFLSTLKRRKIPVYSVSSIFRANQLFFKWYGFPYRRALKCFTHLFVQNQQSADLLASIGINKVSVVGDTRFDRVIAIANSARQLPLVEAFALDNHVLVAGSTWSADEDILASYFNTHVRWKLIIAPHVVSEEHLREIEGKVKGTSVRYTHATMDEVRAADCLIIDCYGLLSSIYRYCDIAYVGGGFGVGIHNLLEAAVYGVPVFFGTNNKKFREAAQLVESGSGFIITGYDDFASKMQELEQNEDELNQIGKISGSYVSRNTGASRLILKKIGL